MLSNKNMKETNKIKNNKCFSQKKIICTLDEN